MRLKIRREVDPETGLLAFQVDCLPSKPRDETESLPCGLVLLKWSVVLIVTVFGLGGLALSLLLVEKYYKLG